MQNILNFLPRICIPKYKKPYNTNELDISLYNNESVLIGDKSIVNNNNVVLNNDNNTDSIKSNELKTEEKECFLSIIDCSK